MKNGLRALAVVALTAAACSGGTPPRPQWLVTVGTDAMVPDLADRVRIDLLDANGTACGGCSRDFAANDPAHLPFSFGVPSDGRFVLLRARLYRANHLLSTGEPDTQTSVDLLGVLPDAPSDVEPLTMSLMMACASVPADVTSRTTCDPASGALVAAAPLGHSAAPLAGTWAPGLKTSCSGRLPPATVCVEGGAFFMGDASLPTYSFGASLGETLVPEHLVQLSPFAIDRDEMTVGAFRALIAKHPEVTERPAARAADSSDEQALCSYVSATDSSADAMSLNCVTRDLAAKLCAVQGKTLPSEAQFEFTARNRGLGTRYPWGFDDAPCEYAIVGRGPTPADPGGVRMAGASDYSCRPQSDGSIRPYGPVAGGAPRDVTLAGVRNLGGNLREWVRDNLSAYTSACWTSARVLRDPVCTEGKYPSLRGGDFVEPPVNARGSLRATVPSATVQISEIGFRCVTDMQPAP